MKKLGFGIWNSNQNSSWDEIPNLTIFEMWHWQWTVKIVIGNLVKRVGPVKEQMIVPLFSKSVSILDKLKELPEYADAENICQAGSVPCVLRPKIFLSQKFLLNSEVVEKSLLVWINELSMGDQKCQVIWMARPD